MVVRRFTTLLLAVALAVAFTTGCTKYAGQDDLQKLDEARQAAVSAEQQLVKVKAERKQVERELADVEKELKAVKADLDRVKAP